MNYSTRPVERKRQVTTTQQVTTFQLPEATKATAGREYILTIPDTQPASVLVVIATTQPATLIAKLQQPPRPTSASAQPASFLVVDDQQPGTSRQLMFTLSPAKPANPPSIASVQQEDSQRNTFGGIPSVLLYQQIDTPHPFSPSQFQTANTSVIFHSSRTVKTSQQVQLAESAQIADQPALSRTNWPL